MTSPRESHSRKQRQSQASLEEPRRRAQARALIRRGTTVRSPRVITAPTTIAHTDLDDDVALCCPTCGYEFIWLSGVDKNHEHTGLEFRCEACPSVSVLVFEQRAGQVFLAWY
jgi:hypothetical protein